MVPLARRSTKASSSSRPAKPAATASASVISSRSTASTESNAITPTAVRCLPPGLDPRPIPSAKGKRHRAIRDRLQRRGREEHQATPAPGRNARQASEAKRRPRGVSRRRSVVPFEEIARLATGDLIGNAVQRVAAELLGKGAPPESVDPPQPKCDRLERARPDVEHLAAGQRTLPRLSGGEVAVEVALVPGALVDAVVGVRPGADAGVRPPRPIGALCRLSRPGRAHELSS